MHDPACMPDQDGIKDKHDIDKELYSEYRGFVLHLLNS